MIINRRNKRRIATLLSMLMMSIGILTCNYTIASADVLDVTAYEYNEEFTDQSFPEPFTLQLDCDTISMLAICEGDTIDNLTCYIVDITHNHLYDASFSFDTDGTTWTYYCAFPSGQYLVYFVGDGNIVKTSAGLVFSKFV